MSLRPLSKETANVKWETFYPSQIQIIFSIRRLVKEIKFNRDVNFDIEL